MLWQLIKKAIGKYTGGFGDNLVMPDLDRLAMARSCMDDGRTREAEEIYNKVLEDQPDHPEALNELGNLYQDTGRSEAAIALHNLAIELEPGFEKAHNNLGNAYLTLGKYDEAVNCYETAIKLKPDYAEAHHNLGLTFKNSGRLEPAISEFKLAININPGFAMAHYNLGDSYLLCGRSQEALKELKSAVTLAPEYAGFYFRLGECLLDCGLFDEASSCFEKVITVNPEIPEAYYYLGDSLKALGALEDAAIQYKKALHLKPDFAYAMNNLGTVYKDLGRPEEAIDQYHMALGILPDEAGLHNNLGLAYQDKGDFDKARAEYEQAITLQSGYADVYLHLVSLGSGSEYLDRMMELVNSPEISEQGKGQLHFALGKIFDKKQLFEQAFSHYRKGNEIVHENLEFDYPAFAGYVEEQIAFYTQDYFRKYGDLGSVSELPVFIIGMPRSGTTLVEQIISSHTQVYGAGELEHMKNLEKRIIEKFHPDVSYPTCMRNLGKDLVLEFGDQYLQDITQRSGNACRVSDKMPDNFLRVGLIKTLFPRARIIHCVRNPLDTCLSIFFNHFSKDIDFAYSLEDTGRYYILYERLMKHWREIFSSEIFEVEYEKLISDQAGVSKNLVHYLGLNWEDRCLDFYKNERSVKTASNTQVRKPIYTSSVNTWKNYDEYLGPLKSILQINSG